MRLPRRPPAREMLLASELGHEGRFFDDRDVIHLLKLEIEREGNQGAFARHHGLDRSYVNHIVNGKRPISDAILKAVGLRKVYTAE